MIVPKTAHTLLCGKDRGGGAHLHKGRLRGLLDLGKRVRQAVQRREWRERDCCAGGDVQDSPRRWRRELRRLNHWHVQCVRRKASQGTHTFGEWHTTLAPTATKTGVQEKNCTVCGYGVCATVPAIRPHRRRATRSTCGCLWDCCASVRQIRGTLPVCKLKSIEQASKAHHKPTRKRGRRNDPLPLYLNVSRKQD